MLRGGERSSSRGRSGPGPRLAGDQIRRRRRAPLPRPRPRRRAIVVVVAGAPPSGQRGVAALSAEVAALRREWREQGADRCARHAANALAAIASADPEGRPALTLVPFLLDALLTRAESRASSAAARGAAAGALFRLAGEPLAKSAIASRPDAVAGLVSLACGTATLA